VTKLQAAVRAKKHRKLVEAKKKAGPTGAEFKEALEPYITTAVATAIAVQWDDALTRIIATDENRESFALVNAVGTTMYAAVLYLVLMYVSEYFNRRLLNMIKQALQILVGWMWKGVVAAVDEDMRNLHLRELSGRDRLWAGFGITTGARRVRACSARDDTLRAAGRSSRRNCRRTSALDAPTQCTLCPAPLPRTTQPSPSCGRPSSLSCARPSCTRRARAPRIPL